MICHCDMCCGRMSHKSLWSEECQAETMPSRILNKRLYLPTVLIGISNICLPIGAESSVCALGPNFQKVSREALLQTVFWWSFFFFLTRCRALHLSKMVSTQAYNRVDIGTKRAGLEIGPDQCLEQLPNIYRYIYT